MPLDLHVLSLPLAFILSQDQTLRCFIYFILFFSAYSSTERRCPASFIDGGPTPSLSSFLRFLSHFFNVLLRTPFSGLRMQRYNHYRTRSKSFCNFFMP